MVSISLADSDPESLAKLGIGHPKVRKDEIRSNPTGILPLWVQIKAKDYGERQGGKRRLFPLSFALIFCPRLPPEITELPFLGLAPTLLRCALSIIIFLFPFHSGTRERRRERITSRNSLNRSPISSPISFTQES